MFGWMDGMCFEGTGSLIFGCLYGLIFLMD